MEALTLMLRDVRMTERLLAFVVTLEPTGRQIASMMSLDPELKPELDSMAASVVEAIETAKRAVDFLQARLEARSAA